MYMHMCVVHVSECAHVCTCMWKPAVDVDPWLFSSSIFLRKSLTKLVSRLDRLARVCSSLLGAGVRDTLPHTAFPGPEA